MTAYLPPAAAVLEGVAMMAGLVGNEGEGEGVAIVFIVGVC